MVKNLVFPRIFLYCVSLPDVVSGLLLSDRPLVRIQSGAPSDRTRSQLCFGSFCGKLPQPRRGQRLFDIETDNPRFWRPCARLKIAMAVS